MKEVKKMAELKPCPFCGGQAIVIECRYRHNESSFFVKCNNSDCIVIPQTYENSDMAYVIDIWNRRAEDGK